MAKKSRTAFLSLALLGLFSLSSCNFFGLFPGGDNHTIEIEGQLPLSESCGFGAYEVSRNMKKGAVQSTGLRSTLVLPIEFADFEFSEQDLSNLEIAFNGTKEETGYWESVQSFYKTSSFGALTLEATIAPVYSSTQTAAEAIPVSSSSTHPSISLLREAVDHAKANGINAKDFDEDGDGYIDGIYLIYAAPTYSSSEGQTLGLSTEYWAFTYWDSKSRNTSDPVGNAYVFASIDFLDQGSKAGIDAHTLIHETGHLLGLSDYYNQDVSDRSATSDAKYRYFSPTGGFDMMDFNILDHNAYTKWLLGWNFPYVVTSDSTSKLEFPVTYTLESSLKGGAFIVIPAAGTTYNGTPFGEYIIIETYEPSGLNYQDSFAPYNGLDRGFSVGGAKIYHVDGRLYLRSGTSYGQPVAEPNVEMLEQYYNYPNIRYMVGASNTPSDSIRQGFWQIHLLESDAELTFDEGAYGQYVMADDSTLFNATEGHNYFDMEKFSSFFYNGNPLLNSGEEFGYSITINAVGYDEDGVLRTSVTIDRV